MKLKITFCFLIVILMTSFVYSQEAKQTIYTLLVIADADPSIGRAVEVDRKRIESIMNEANNICNVRIETLLSSRNELKASLISKWTKSISPGADDVVFIYYSGHGGMDRNNNTFLYLQDGIFYRAKLVETIEALKDSRLRVIITDCCSNGPEPEVTVFRAIASHKVLRNLLLESEGLVHISAASEGEYSWCSPKYGGWFTRAFAEAIQDSSDVDGDNFVSWEEILQLTREAVKKKFDQAYQYFSSEQKKDMKNRGITSQTPKAYSLPRRKSTLKPIETVAVEQESLTQDLWGLSNPDPYFKITAEPDQRQYTNGSKVNIKLRATASCYVIIVNWNSRGQVIRLFPNNYETNNFILQGRDYLIPGDKANFDIRVSGSGGQERIKVLAFRNRYDSVRIRNLIPLDDGGGSVLSRIAVVPKETETTQSSEESVLSAIGSIRKSDWASANCTIQLQ